MIKVKSPGVWGESLLQPMVKELRFLNALWRAEQVILEGMMLPLKCGEPIAFAADKRKKESRFHRWNGGR